MKKGIISQSEARLLLIVLALAIVAGSYFFGFSKLMEEAKVIEASNVQDKTRVETLENMEAKKVQVIKETDELKEYVKKVVEKYPVLVPQEKILYLMQELEDATGVHFTNGGFVIDNLISELEPLPDAKVQQMSYGYSASVNAAFSASYDSFKEMLAYVKEMKDRSTLPSVSVSYNNEDGQLTGQLTFKMFYITNTDKEYEEIPDLEIPSGLENIFHTVEE